MPYPLAQPASTKSLLFFWTPIASLCPPVSLQRRRLGGPSRVTRTTTAVAIGSTIYKGANRRKASRTNTPASPAQSGVRQTTSCRGMTRRNVAIRPSGDKGFS